MNVSFEDCGEFMGNLELRLAPVYIFLICMNIIIIYIYNICKYYLLQKYICTHRSGIIHDLDHVPFMSDVALRYK